MPALELGGKVKLEDAVKVDKSCENSDGGFWTLPRELKFGGIG